MPELITGNWETIVAGILAVAVLFWPSLKPIASRITKVIKTKDDPSTEHDERILEGIKLAQLLIHMLRERGDEEGVERAIELQKQLLDPPKKKPEVSSQ